MCVEAALIPHRTVMDGFIQCPVWGQKTDSSLLELHFWVEPHTSPSCGERSHGVRPKMDLDGDGTIDVSATSGAFSKYRMRRGSQWSAEDAALRAAAPTRASTLTRTSTRPAAAVPGYAGHVPRAARLPRPRGRLAPGNPHGQHTHGPDGRARDAGARQQNTQGPLALGHLHHYVPSRRRRA